MTDNTIISEVIVVEGKDDEAAVKKAVNAEIITTHGYGLSAAVYKRIEEAYNRCGIIIFTDPDYAGSNIRRKLSEKFPKAKHAYISKAAGTKKNDIGVENASPEAILAALKAVHAETAEKRTAFSTADLYANGLLSGENAAQRRDKVGEILGIGYGNAKTFLNRLNNYGITEEEFRKAVDSL